MFKKTTSNKTTFSKDDAPEYITKMQAILVWADSKPNFTIDFVESVLERTEKYQSISDGQKGPSTPSSQSSRLT